MPAILYPGKVGTGIEETERILAAQRLVIDPSQMLPWFMNFAGEGPLPWNGVGGTGAISWVSGGLSYATGATAGSFGRMLLYSDGGGQFGKVIRSGANWFMSARFSITTAVTAQTEAFVGAESNAGTFALAMGVNGAVSAGFFSLKGLTGTPITSTVAVDTALHTHRAWKVGSSIFYQVDNTITAGNADVNVDVMPYLICQNGTDAVNRAMTVIWMSIFAPSL